MKYEEVEAAFVGWITPASLNLTAESLQSRVEAIRALAENGDLSAMVSTAHGRNDNGSLAAVEGQISAFDPTYVVGKTELAAKIAGSSLMLLFASNTLRAAEASLLVESAAFSGWAASLDELHARATEVHFEMSIHLRRRLLPRKPAAAPRLKASEPQSTMDEVISAVNAGARRYDELYDLLQQRLELVDEEVNLLWWARSRNTEEPVDKVDAVDRAIRAAIALNGLVSIVPALPVALELLPEVAGTSHKKTSLLEAASSGAAELLVSAGIPDPLLPMVTAATIAADYASEPEAIPALIRKAGIDPKLSVPIADIAFQVLRELSIQRVRS